MQDAELDAAVKLWPQIVAYIRQGQGERADFAASSKALIALMPS